MAYDRQVQLQVQPPNQQYFVKNHVNTWLELTSHQTDLSCIKHVNPKFDYTCQ